MVWQHSGVGFSYQPGSGTAVCGPALAALVALKPTHPLVGRLAATAATASSADALVELLLSPGLRAVSDFLILEKGGEGPRVVVRGSYAAGLPGGELVTGSGLLTDVTLPAGTEIDAHTGPAPTGIRLPLGVGVVLADRIWLDSDELEALPAADSEPLTDLLASAAPPPEAAQVETWASLPEPVAKGPIVTAAVCEAGHLNPPYTGLCRICHQPIGVQRTIEVERPSLGVLRLSTGETVRLDSGVVFGRRPRLPADARGEVQLVTLSDPNRDVSAVHLEVILDGWNVLVRDLGSTNGTLVVPPGGPRTSLRAYEPFLIEPGTRVVLAGAIEIFWDAAG